NIPIGKPIANTTVYIVDKNKQIQPISAAGELWTGGDGVARGYMNHPELTNDQFIFTRVAFEKAPLDPAKLLFNYHSPLTTHHSPIYKTGDLARWLPGGPPAGGDSGGVIEFLGRIDNQLKIRGVRIEPAEIEKQLLTKNGIKEALVDVRMHEHKTAGENFTEKYLCAYIVSENKIDPSELREHLSTALPDYMIPSFFVFLEKFPVTPNGKIDRNALPFPVLDTSGQYSPPQSELEEKLVEIWSEILRIKKDIIGIDNNFFELGGNSLNATLFIGKLHQEMNVKLPVGEVFRKPKIRELAQSIKASAKNVFSAIEPTEKKEYYPMSSAQKRLYTLRQMEAESTAYNMPVILILAGIPRQDRLMDTFAELIKRHESLRTSFDIIDKQMVQVIHETVAFAMEYNEPGPGEEREIIHAFEKPFNLNQAPLLRAGLVRTPGETYVLMIDTHHIIMDGFSLGILQQEFISIYNGEELPGLTLTYKDYSQWQNSEKGKETLKKQENYWLKQLSGELPVLNIPTDFPRPKIQRFSADAVDFEIRDEWYGLLKKLSLRENTTVHILLVTVFNIFLARLSGQEDIITGITMPGRTGIHLEKVVGLVTNTLVLRSFPYKYKDFLHYLAEVKEKSADAYENQDYPLEYIVDKLQVNREPGRNPIFDFMFEVMNDLTPVGGENTGENKGEKSTLNFRPYPYQRQISVFDMIWTGNDTGNVVRFCVSYRVDLFKRDSIELMIDYYLALVKQILTGSRVKIKDLTHWPPVAEQTNMEINFKF
ncbi:MAG: condensation domain-containing protein, partial [Acidobacteria bacterium]|nr:condensation domain-containing protein [Acidobacteriota bacterium]